MTYYADISAKTVVRARLAWVGTLLVICTASLYGRSIQKAASWLVDAIPLFALLAFCGGVWLLVKALSRLKEQAEGALPPLGTVLKMALFFFLCALVISEGITQYPIERIHFVKYSALGFFGFYSQRAGNRTRKTIAAAILACAVGTIEESAQFFIPNRYFTYNDVLINVVSGIYGAVLGHALERLLVEWGVLKTSSSLSSQNN